MAQTQRFRELSRRLRELREHMLPRRFSPTGTYSERQKDRARGYRLLAHAEMESYLEDVSRDAVLEAVRRWKAGRQAEPCIVAFLAGYHCSWYPDSSMSDEHVLEFARSRKKPSDTASDIIDVAMTQYVVQLKENHGVRIRNLQKILVPAGVDLTSLDQTWLTTLDDFGMARGLAAHNGAGATQAIDPKTEHQLIVSLLHGLKKLDQQIAALMT